MSENKEISYIKDRLFEIERKSLDEALSSFSSRDDLIVGLLTALGFDQVVKESSGGIDVYYSVVQNVRVDLVSYDSISNSLSGNAALDLNSAFIIVKSIEGELSDAMYYPSDLRRKVVDSLIQDVGVSDDFFRKVLAGWKTYR